MSRPKRSHRSQNAGPTFEVGSQQGHIQNIGGDQHVYDLGTSPTEDYRRAGVGTKLLIVVGVLMAVAAIGVVGFAVISSIGEEAGEPATDELKRTLPIAGGLFFGGFILVLIGNLIVGLRRRR